MNFQISDIKKILENKDLEAFVCKNFEETLASIGYSKEFIHDFTKDLGSIDAQAFGKKWESQLEKNSDVGFFQDLVPQYFEKYVIPATPDAKKILDIGCGTGILGKLYCENSRFGEVVGIDIRPYAEWKKFANKKLHLSVVKEAEFAHFIENEKPDCVTLTWTLHHMEFGEQERYLQSIHKILKPGARVVLLEDSYSETLSPENGQRRCDAFMKWSSEDRRNIMTVFDWMANRVLEQRYDVPVPGSYRTLEEWCKVFETSGFRTIAKKFIGFPDKRDINTPQSILVFEKV
jgi:ubiquinone/menaquinone biosynthesis C-methylase UbiE